MRDRFGQETILPVPTYTVPRTSALALDMLKLSLRENSVALRKFGIFDPLARPTAGTKLYYPVYDLIEDFAVSLLRQSVPFYYKTVTGEVCAVQSSTQANAAIDYLPQTIKLWGYVRTTVAPGLETTLPVPPLYTPPVEVDYEYPPSEQIEEEKVILWAVSRSLGEVGIPSYPLLSGRKERVALSERKFDLLVHRAKYIADQMVQQNTYSPRL